MLDKFRDTLKKFVEIYGTKDQLNMLVEKMGKLTSAIHRYNRKIDKCKTEDDRKALQNQAEQALAEVLVLAEQAKIIFDERNIANHAELQINKTKSKLTV